MAAAKVSIELKGHRALGRALKLLGETEAPFIREAMDKAGHKLDRAVTSRAPGGMARTVAFTGVKGKGGALRAVVVVKHGGAKAMEFGRTTYYRGFTGRRMKATGSKFKSRGQRARPFIGIKTGGHAVAAVRDDVQRDLMDAYEKEWERVAGGPD